MRIFYIPQSYFQSVLKASIPSDAKAEFLANLCRINTLYMIKRAGSGHIGSSFSCLDILSWLHLEVLEKDDRCFSSKGHDAPGYYSLLAALGVISFEKIHQLRRLNGLPGHPDVSIPGMVTNTGSLGMGISKAKGMIQADRLSNNKSKKRKYFVITGDGELQEGQFWESLTSAQNEKMNELTVIVDHNKIQSDTWVKKVSDLGDLVKKVSSFGWAVDRCDGHSISELKNTYRKLSDSSGPRLIVADTIKGRGVSFMEGSSMPESLETYPFHSGAPSDELMTKAFEELSAKIKSATQKFDLIAPDYSYFDLEPIAPKKGVRQALIPAYASKLEQLGQKEENLVVLDADLVLDCGLIPFRKSNPKNFIECGIAEQDMVSQAGGLALSGKLPIVHSFACFLTPRANEQIYNNATEKTRIIYSGSLAGIVPGGPGHSHQSIRDLALMGSVPQMVLTEPANEIQTQALLEDSVLRSKESTYIRLSSVPWMLPESLAEAPFPSEGKPVNLQTGKDILLISSGPIFLGETLKAAEILKARGLSVGVSQILWLNRFDQADWKALAKNYKKWFAVENHFSRGGWIDALNDHLTTEALHSEVRLFRRSIDRVPFCGSNDQVLEAHGVSAEHLADWVQKNS